MSPTFSFAMFIHLIVCVSLCNLVISKVCNRNEVLPFLEFPFFRAHLHVGESLTCRFTPPKPSRSELRWKCRISELFKGVEESKSEVANITLLGLKIPGVLYNFKHSWCSCTIRIHKADGSTCQRTITQSFQFFPPIKPGKNRKFAISVGSTKLSWLRENIIATPDCASVHLCRDERFLSSEKEDTKMTIIKESPRLRKAIRSYPYFSFRYPFAVLELCKMERGGVFFYQCIHRDSSRGAGETMFLNLTINDSKKDLDTNDQVHKVDRSPKAQKYKAIKNPMEVHHILPFNITIVARPKVGSVLKNIIGLKRKKMHKSSLNSKLPQLSRYTGSKENKQSRQKHVYRQKLRARNNALNRLSLQLERMSRYLDRVLTGVKVAVTGCVILVLAAMGWFYAGKRIRRQNN